METKTEQPLKDFSNITPPYDFALVYAKKEVSKDDMNLISNILKNNCFGVKIQPVEGKNKKIEKYVLFLKHIDPKSLLLEAEKMRIEKEVVDFTNTKSTDDINLSLIKQQSAKRNQRLENFYEVGKKLHPNIQKMEKFKKFKYSKKNKFFKCPENLKEYEIDEMVLENVFTPAEILMFKYNKLNQVKYEVQGKIVNMIEYHKDSHNLISLVPLHNDEQLDQVYTKDDLRCYFGENISFYFEFLSYFQKWIIFPMVCGILTEILDYFHEHEDCDNSPFEAIYAFIVVIWASVFYSKWKQHEKSIRTLYRSFGKNFKIQQKFHHYDHQELETKVDKITGEEYQYFPIKKRVIKYSIFVLKSIPIIAITLYFLIASLNIRGLIDDTHTILKIDFFWQMGEKDGIFYTKGYWSFVPNILHVVIVNKINSYYMKLCFNSSKNELYDTEYKFQDSIIQKRFVFEFFSYFIDLFYVAFVNFDILALKKQLIALYSVDEVRRLLTETVIPMISNFSRREKQVIKSQFLHSIPKSIGNKIKVWESNQEKKLKKEVKKVENPEKEYILQKLVEIEKPEYKSFDDYIEVIMNFGYLVLFASAFTLAPIYIFAFNLLEYFSDKMKILATYQRPLPKKAKGISSWNYVLNTMTIICVITNIILFSFSSDQMAEFFPSLFMQDQEETTFNSFLQSITNTISQKASLFLGGGEETHVHSLDDTADDELAMGMGLIGGEIPVLAAVPKRGKARYVIAIIFAIEHVMFLLIWLVRKIVNSKRDWVDIYLERKEYVKKIK